MENITPLQHSAKELREDFKRSEERQMKQDNNLAMGGRELLNKFISSFSNLYSLIIGSNIDIQTTYNSTKEGILLTYKQNKIFISLNKGLGTSENWNLLNRSYKPTLPNKTFGMPADREDEHRLIIAIEEMLFGSSPVLD
ncbi:hypothetical protein Q0590_28215 [Rhodocytophaga aerolata]|uniref:DUF5655 domain-containing protein n=1 Tax=Rhodocytophaga aerolata TaxID=455078 RepID=A0ABT8RDM3_9BACT|nr:hypothetical protein [Rhodocytophaga aerolata]MDO1450198.1 hypothetical protein [Rhodocytophaga aerolata]